jgi:hypothetical protein
VGLVVTAVAAAGAWAVASWLWGQVSKDPASADSLVVTGSPSTGQPSPSNLSRTPAPSRDERGPQFAADTPVHLLGDSLAVGIEQDVIQALAPRTVVTDAAEGRRTATSVALLAANAPSTSPIWIVSLGTNDNPETFADQAAQLVELAGPDRCVVWFDIWRSDTQDSVNAALGSLAAAHPNVHVIEWYAAALAHPEWFTGLDVHPSSIGYGERGQLAVQAVDEYCTTPQPS